MRLPTILLITILSALTLAIPHEGEHTEGDAHSSHSSSMPHPHATALPSTNRHITGLSTTATAAAAVSGAASSATTAQATTNAGVRFDSAPVVGVLGVVVVAVGFV